MNDWVMLHNASALAALVAFVFIGGFGIGVIVLNAVRRRRRSSTMSALKTTIEQPSESPIPITHFELERRYDLYCSLATEQRLYQNVKLVGIRTFDRISQHSSGALGGLLEIEAANGTRMMIPQFGIQMICEHGAEPTYKLCGVGYHPAKETHGETSLESGHGAA